MSITVGDLLTPKAPPLVPMPDDDDDEFAPIIRPSQIVTPLALSIITTNSAIDAPTMNYDTIHNLVKPDPEGRIYSINSRQGYKQFKKPPKIKTDKEGNEVVPKPFGSAVQFNIQSRTMSIIYKIKWFTYASINLPGILLQPGYDGDECYSYLVTKYGEEVTHDVTAGGNKLIADAMESLLYVRDHMERLIRAQIEAGTLKYTIPVGTDSSTYDVHTHTYRIKYSYISMYNHICRVNIAKNMRLNLTAIKEYLDKRVSDTDSAIRSDASVCSDDTGCHDGTQHTDTHCAVIDDFQLTKPAHRNPEKPFLLSVKLRTPTIDDMGYYVNPKQHSSMLNIYEGNGKEDIAKINITGVSHMYKVHAIYKNFKTMFEEHYEEFVRRIG